MGIAFPNLASASQQAATSSTGCSTNGWTDTVTVTNSPNASAGEAVISGTGTALDGSTLAAGGGSQTIVLDEPFSVASVTVSGTLSWSSTKFSAPIVTVATQPKDCGGAAPAAAPAVISPNAPEGKVYVCKYVGTPGVDEVLQTGQNPIDVSANAIPENPVVVGSYFADAQGRSFVLAFDTGQTPPTRADCPGGSPTTSTVTVTSPGPTVTVTGPTTTVTVTGTVTETTTAPGATVTIPGPTTTVSVPGPTVTLTESATATITNATTVTVHDTVTVPGPGTTVTVTQQLEGTTSTVTETVGGPTVTETVTAAVAGTSTSAAPAVVTVTKVNCPPGSAVQGGSLAFTGGGNDAMMSLIGGALAAGGAVCLLMSRKRREPRTH